MAKKRFLASLALVLLFAALAAAQQERTISFTFTFYLNGSVEASDVWVRYGVPDLRNAVEGSDYKIVLSFKDKTDIGQFYDVIFLMATETEEVHETFQAPYTLLNAEFAYKENPDKIEVYHKGKLMYQKSLEMLCNNDNVCNNNETSISCPSDCQKSIKDGWCDSLQDGICDPDCQIEADIDCTAKEEDSTNKLKVFFPVILIIVILGFIGFFVYKKKEKKY